VTQLARRTVAYDDVAVSSDRLAYREVTGTMTTSAGPPSDRATSPVAKPAKYSDDKWLTKIDKAKQARDETREHRRDKQATFPVHQTPP